MAWCQLRSEMETIESVWLLGPRNFQMTILDITPHISNYLCTFFRCWSTLRSSDVNHLLQVTQENTWWEPLVLHCHGLVHGKEITWSRESSLPHSHRELLLSIESLFNGQSSSLKFCKLKSLVPTYLPALLLTASSTAHWKFLNRGTWAISGTSGSLGFGSVSKLEIDKSTFEIVSAGLHWSCSGASPRVVHP